MIAFRSLALALAALIAPSLALAQVPFPPPAAGSSSVTPSGATGGRTLAAIEADTVNVKFGWSGVAPAKGDTIGLSSCTIAAAASLLTCSAATFTAADSGKRFYLQGSGAANIPQTGTITYASATTVTLSAPAVVATPQWGIYNAPAAPITIASAGAGYTNGTQTLTITGGTCTTQPQVSVTVAGNVVTAVLSTVTAGVCTVAPSSASATTGGGGTGATFTTSAFQAAGQFLYGTDDTAAVTAAAAAAVASGKKLVFPSGGYWLATGTTAIPLSNIAVEGDGAVSYGWPFVQKGSWVLIGNQTSAAFSGMAGVDWNGLSVYYPEQDNSAATPVAFPSTFTSTAMVNTTIRNSRFVNSRDLVTITNVSGSGLGRVTLDNVRAYCVRYCFNYANGQADVLTIGPNNYFGPGGFDNSAPYGPANLARYTATSGEFVHIDVGSSAYTLIDGLMFTGFIIQATRYGVRVVSGTVDVSNISNVNFDAVQTPLSIEGTSSWTSTAFTGGTIYATNIYDLTAAAPVFNVTTSAATVDLSITGVNVSYALGPVLYELSNGLRHLTFTGNMIANWGRSTTSATYFGFHSLGGNNASTLDISGNLFACNDNANIISAVLTTQGTNRRTNVAGNAFESCTNVLVAQGDGGTVNFVGNTARGTSGGTINDVSVTNMLLMSESNMLDTAQTRRAPTLSSCGTSPAAVAPANNQQGSITIGTGVVTACTLSFTATLARTPVCTGNSGAAAIAAAVTAVSTTAVTFGFSADNGAGKLYYQCAF